MDTKTSFKNKKWNLNKTFSMKFRFLTTIIFAMLSITFFVGGLSIYEVDNYIQAQAEDFVSVTCTNESTQINDSLVGMEKSVKIMESYLMDFFKNKADVENRALQEEVIRSADQMFIDVAKHTSTGGAIAYYFRFDPSISDATSGLFYSKINGSDDFLSLQPTDLTIYEKDDTEHVGWFWEPYEAGEPIWMKPYHNQNNDVMMISYVIPMYFEEKFIGVVGMDFDYMVLADMVHGIQIYENGFAHLEIDGVVICNDEQQSNSEAIVDSKDYLRVSEELVNGMTLVLSASYDDIWQIRYEIGFKILCVTLILSALFTIIAVFVVKKIVDPIKKLTDASVKLSNGHYDVEIVESNTYEINLLSTAFENMAKRLREREEVLHMSANRDSMTGLRNTTSFKSWAATFEQQIQDKNADFGVVAFDVNNLKITNDRYGHEVGNKLIKTAAKVISDTFKRSPVFRLGGDEFLAVLQNSDLENIENLLIEFDFKCQNTFIGDNAEIPVSIARGFARYDSDKDLSMTVVLKRADDAMYQNKSKMKSGSL